MYTPDAFREDRQPVLHDFMRAHPFAALVTNGASGLAVSHLPLMLETGADGGAVLRGHVARANPHWKDAADGIDALAVFTGPQAYVTPQWYPSKKDGGRAVPTWNYAVVHAHGRLRAVQDKDWLLAHVSAMSDRQEAAFAAPWAVGDAPADYIDKMLKAIVGLELTVARLEGKWKLSQNRSEADRAGARAGLAARGDSHSAAVAALMQSL